MVKLTAKQAKNAKPDKGRRSGRIADGRNLFLQVSTGSAGQIRRSWVFKYQLDGSRHEAGLGSLRDVPLAEAREMAGNLRKQLLNGVDPLAARRQQRQQRQRDNAKAMTFGECVEAYIAAHGAGWKSKKHREQWQTSLARQCRALTDLAVKDIDKDAVMRVLTPLWKATPVTGGRVRNRIEQVLAYAKARGLRDGDNPASWFLLKPMLVSLKKAHTVKHHPALPYEQLPAFIAELRQRPSLAARVLEACILTATRSGEIRGAHRSEFDLARKLWVIPAGRMKAGKEHRIPLTDRVIEIINQCPGDHPFHCGEQAMLKLIGRMRANATTHGFRSSFRDWASECTNAPSHVVELSLAHKIGSEVEQAYHRTDLIAKRTALMKQWADHCDRPASASVTPIRRIDHA